MDKHGGVFVFCFTWAGSAWYSILIKTGFCQQFILRYVVNFIFNWLIPLHSPTVAHLTQHRTPHTHTVINTHTNTHMKEFISIHSDTISCFQEFLLTPLQFGIPNSRLRYYLIAKRSPLKFSFDRKSEVCFNGKRHREVYCFHLNEGTVYIFFLKVFYPCSKPL